MTHFENGSNISQENGKVGRTSERTSANVRVTAQGENGQDCENGD